MPLSTLQILQCQCLVISEETINVQANNVIRFPVCFLGDPIIDIAVRENKVNKLLIHDERCLIEMTRTHIEKTIIL